MIKKPFNPARTKKKLRYYEKICGVYKAYYNYKISSIYNPKSYFFKYFIELLAKYLCFYFAKSLINSWTISKVKFRNVDITDSFFK